MLYDRWRAVAAEQRGDWALRDLASRREWTFGELLAWGDACEAPASEIVFPKGNGSEFIFELLRAWRHDRVACPLEADQQEPAIPRPFPRNIVHLKRTSATTGAARFVAFTAWQLAADPANIIATMGLRREWPNLGAISLAHSYGFSNLVLPLLLHGIPLALIGSPLPEAVRRAGEEEQSVTLAGVPALWRVWHDGGALTPKIKRAISAAAPLPLQLERAVFESAGIKLHNFMGASESGGIAYDRSEIPREDASMVGSAMEGVSLCVTNNLLEVRSSAVAETYLPGASENLGNGMFRTSDLAELRDGKLFVVGRASDVIQTAGRKVAPEEIERVLAGHPGVRECLVFDAPVGAENRIIAVLAGEAAALGEIKTAAGEKLPAWQLPREWLFVESLAANQRGKVSRAEWRRRFLAGEI